MRVVRIQMSTGEILERPPNCLFSLELGSDRPTNTDEEDSETEMQKKRDAEVDAKTIAGNRYNRRREPRKITSQVLTSKGGLSSKRRKDENAEIQEKCR